MEQKKVLDENLVMQELNRWSKDDYPLTDIQIQQSKELFYRLMNEDMNKSKSLPIQEALLAEVARKTSNGETVKQIFNQHSDNRHLSFYDTQIRDGTTDDIIEVMKKHNLPSSILRGVKYGTVSDLSVNVDGNKIDIKAKIDPSPTGEEETFNSLQIYMNGKEIYNSDDKNGINSIDIDYDDVEDVKFTDYYAIDERNKMIEEQTTVSKKYTFNKNKEPRKSVVIKEYNDNGNIITLEYSDVGDKLVHRYRDSKGRFTKR